MLNVPLGTSTLSKLSQLYKTLYKIRTRRQVEKESSMLQAVLEKRECSDIPLDESPDGSRQDHHQEVGAEEENLAILNMVSEESVFILLIVPVVVQGMDD